VRKSAHLGDMGVTKEKKVGCAQRDFETPGTLLIRSSSTLFFQAESYFGAGFNKRALAKGNKGVGGGIKPPGKPIFF